MHPLDQGFLRKGHEVFAATTPVEGVWSQSCCRMSTVSSLPWLLTRRRDPNW